MMCYNLLHTTSMLQWAALMELSSEQVCNAGLTSNYQSASLHLSNIVEQPDYVLGLSYPGE